MSDIRQKYEEIIKTIPQGVALVAATKQRTIEDIREAYDVGIGIVGENYVQEAQNKYEKIEGLKWHMIGHLQRNKVKDAIKVFDCIQSVDSIRLAKEINDQCAKLSIVMPIFIQINIGEEESKHGLCPDNTLEMVNQIAEFPNIRTEGLMTMEPYFDNPEDARPYFVCMKRIFDEIKHNIPNTDLMILSMGMSNSYRVAIQEGSNMVRIGTSLFGPRKLP
jgi:pyridoxal phosphate enzyme (YggS family)